MPSALKRYVPILDWAPRYERRNLRGDLVAGLTVGAMLVPQAMAYAMLAGLPPQVGLYASIVPVVVYALFGTSRQLAVGPVALVSLLTAAALAPVADEGTAAYLAAAALLALVVGAIHIVLGVGRLGFVVNLLSHSVLVGFTAAAAIIIGFSQVKSLLGITIPRSDSFIEAVGEVASHLGEVNWPTLAMGTFAIALLLVLRRWFKALPGALIVVALTTVITAVFSLDEQGVKTVGEIPSNLPALALPDMDTETFSGILPAAITITLVGFMESIAIAKVFARRNRYEVDPNQELIALGAANAAGGLVGAYPVTGGFSRTAVNGDAGARTPLASIITAGLVLLTLLFLTPLFRMLPTATLAAIIVVAVAGLVDVKEARHLWEVKRSDFVVMVVAFVATLTLGIETGILVAVGVSLVVVFARIMRPHTAVLGRLAGSAIYRNVDRFPDTERYTDAAVLRLDVSLNFANASFLKKRLARLEEEHPEGRLRTIVLDMNGVNDLDASAAQTIEELLDDYEDRDVALHLADVKGPVRDVLRRSGLWQRFGDRIHVGVHEALEAAGAHPTEALAPPSEQPLDGEAGGTPVGLDERVGTGASATRHD